MSWKENVSKMSKIRNWNGKLYKILQGNKSCHGGNFKWSLPEGDKPGNWTPIIENVEMCICGYHLTTHYAHWSDKKNISIYEAEGDIVDFDNYDKVVCSRARLLKLVENPFNKNNSGNCNSGKFNTGDCNSGNYNFGDKNSGSYNSGYRNSGNWNSGWFNSGYFCVGHRYNKIFDKPIPKNWEPKFPNWIYFDLLQEGYYASWQEAFKNATIKDIKELLALPNFDYEIFLEITSIAKKQIKGKLGE